MFKSKTERAFALVAFKVFSLRSLYRVIRDSRIIDVLIQVGASAFRLRSPRPLPTPLSSSTTPINFTLIAKLYYPIHRAFNYSELMKNQLIASCSFCYSPVVIMQLIRNDYRSNNCFFYYPLSVLFFQHFVCVGFNRIEKL